MYLPLRDDVPRRGRPFDEQHLEAASGGVARDPDPVDAAADDEQIDLVHGLVSKTVVHRPVALTRLRSSLGAVRSF